MPRQPLLAIGIAAMAIGLAIGPGLANRTKAADEPAQGESHATATQAGHGPAAMTPADAAHAAEGHAAGEPNPLEVQPNLVIFTVLVFLGLLFVLGKFAWKPLLDALHQREEHLEHVLHETERARNESEALLAEHRRQLAAAEDQIRTMIEEGKKSAQAAGDDIIRRAQAEAQASKERAERDIAGARDKALDEIWSKTADLAVSVAGKVLNKSLTPEDHRRLIDSAVGELNATANGHGGAR
ncbi:MAG: F0F1 ATP synthase subunit B [Isosphaeraceae bacterium]